VVKLYEVLSLLNGKESIEIIKFYKGDGKSVRIKGIKKTLMEEIDTDWLKLDVLQISPEIGVLVIFIV